MTFKRKTLAALFLSGTTAWLAGCGGGTSGSGSTLTSEPGSGDSGNTDTESTAVSGRITGFGSIIVNGVHFDADAAQIMHDGEPITEDDLKVGMIVHLSGAIDADGVNGVATEVKFDEELKGPVTSIDLTHNTLVVLGQTVIIDEDTALDNLTLDTLAVKDFLEVSGFFDAEGALRATLVEREDTESEEREIELKGIVHSLDAASSQFLLGAQTVDYSGAEFDDIPDNTLAEGMFVEVKASGLSETGVLLAREVEYEERGDEEREEGAELELEGLITAVTSATQFAVNGRTVVLTAETEFEDGSAGDLTPNSKIKVEGELNAEGALVAEKVELRRRGSLEIEALVDSVHIDSNSLNVFGAEIITTPTTRWEDDSEAEVRYFDLADLNPGDKVKVKGYQNAEGAFVATALERKDADEEQEIELTAPVASTADGILSALGVQIVLGPELDAEERSELEALMAGLATGDLIKVKGTVSATNQLSAVEIELEEDDGRNEFGGERRHDEDEDEDREDSDDREEETSDEEDSDDEDEQPEDLEPEEDESDAEA